MLSEYLITKPDEWVTKNRIPPGCLLAYSCTKLQTNLEKKNWVIDAAVGEVGKSKNIGTKNTNKNVNTSRTSKESTILCDNNETDVNNGNSAVLSTPCSLSTVKPMEYIDLGATSTFFYTSLNNVKSHREFYSCDICAKKFLKYEDVFTHTQLHYAHHKCRVCGKQCENERHLLRHMESHRKTSSTLVQTTTRDPVRAYASGSVGKIRKHDVLQKENKNVDVTSFPTPPIGNASKENGAWFQSATFNLSKVHVLDQSSKEIIPLSSRTPATTIEWKAANDGMKSKKSGSMVGLHPLCTLPSVKNMEVNSQDEPPAGQMHKSIVNKSNSKTMKKGYLCEICGKVYTRKYGLKIHTRIHMGYKPLKCKFCDRSFGDPSNMAKHLRLHGVGMNDSFKCPWCGKICARKRDLERHMKSRHPSSDVNEYDVDE